jgi:8-amino-7-oxononanoate synthase
MAPRPDDFAPELDDLRARGLARRLRVLEGAPPEVLLRGAGRVVVFASNDYLGLAHDPRVVAAARDAAAAHGAGAAASRLITGTGPLHEALEARLAAFKGAERALLFGSGYQANVGAVSALAGADDVVFSDALNHASIVDGCRLSRARVVVYPHGDVDALEMLLRRHPTGRRRLLVTESVFSMDGDIAPLADLVAVAERHGCLLLVDEAHATGVFGPDGRGVVAALGLGDRVHVTIGTLSKALGSYGGFVAARASTIEWLINRARSFVFSTAPPPPSLGAALAALDIVQREPERRRRLWDNVERLRTGLATLGAPLPAAPAPIVPLVVGAPEAAVAASEALVAHGVFVQAIRPPTVPAGTSRLRVTVSAAHTPGHLDRLVTALGALAGEGMLAGAARSS